MYTSYLENEIPHAESALKCVSIEIDVEHTGYGLVQFAILSIHSSHSFFLLVEWHSVAMHTMQKHNQMNLKKHTQFINW